MKQLTRPGNPPEEFIHQVPVHSSHASRRKPLLSWFAALLLATSFAELSARASSCVPAPLGLVAWWRAEGDVANATGLHTVSEAQNVAYAPGKVGQAWLFTASNQRIALSAQRLQVGRDPGLTVEAWIRPTSTNTNQYLIYSYEPWANAGPGLFVELLSGGGVRANIAQRMRISREYYVIPGLVQTGPGLVEPDAWTHVAVTYDLASATARIYVNGSLQAEALVPPAGIPRWDTRFITYQPLSLSGDTYRGLVDEISFYNRALTPEEIQALVTSDSAGKCLAEPAWILLPRDTIMLVTGTNVWEARAIGAEPIEYQWFRDGQPLADATSPLLTLGPFSQAGIYTYQVVASNALGARTSAPVRVDARWLIAQEAIYDPLTTGYFPWALIEGTNIVSDREVALFLFSGFPNGQIFYTLNGTTPDFRGLPYPPAGGLIVLNRSAWLRAAVCSSDLTMRWEMPPIRIVIPQRLNLEINNPGGGQVTVDPPGVSFLRGTEVTVRAVPDPGWTFLGWLGDVTGTKPELRLLMDRPRRIRPVFATGLRLSVVGEGSIQTDPSLDLYPFGQPVRLTAVPAPGQRFALWGGNAGGTINPVIIVPTTPEPTVTALFAPLESNQVTVTVILEGQGQVIANPSNSIVPINTVVTLRAVPEPGWTFIGWAGDVTGTDPVIQVPAETSKVVRARFRRLPELVTGPGSREAAGLRLELRGMPGRSVTVETSEDLLQWTPWMEVTPALDRVTLLDTNALRLPHRFYRARLQP
ncbi:hypothetical protein G4L39_09645 [Limisphaera ngatamarikiensis]|uniref:LamG-like jellyroll fold domain-containing protein n=1 Tax=Limisphaera ngatamarikiensis TaxID=1324935 RepID=A0A6M1RSP9_9BACT|nr:LamG-like jellyroll fold domain-containing protein [Limisphaera ngatamarikiensis]NGO39655.1 hypothetical protein [Limisphaera ngatamarikiensis]